MKEIQNAMVHRLRPELSGGTCVREGLGEAVPSGDAAYRQVRMLGFP